MVDNGAFVYKAQIPTAEIEILKNDLEK